MEKDSVNQDRNIIGRIGALVVIVAAVVALGRVCGMESGMCPIGRMCPFMQSHGMTETAAPAAEAPAETAAPAAEAPSAPVKAAKPTK